MGVKRGLLISGKETKFQRNYSDVTRTKQVRSLLFYITKNFVIYTGRLILLGSGINGVRMGRQEMICRVLVGKTFGKRSIGRLRRRREDNNRISWGKGCKAGLN
jgi:hypothetical protein